MSIYRFKYTVAHIFLFSPWCLRQSSLVDHLKYMYMHIYVYVYIYHIYIYIAHLLLLAPWRLWQPSLVDHLATDQHLGLHLVDLSLTTESARVSPKAGGGYVVEMQG